MADTTLLEQWTRYQNAVAQRAIFSDVLDFQVDVKSTSGLPGVCAFEGASHDWNQPVPSHIDLESTCVEGLRHVGGVDISFRVGDEGDANDAVVCLVILEYPSMKLKHTFLQRVRMTQPYIPSFLAMRELDHLVGIWAKAKTSVPADDLPQIIFVDGFGRWHERQAGLATALGVEVGTPTIGIGKEYQVLRADLETWSTTDTPPIALPPWPESQHFRHSQKSFRDVAKRLLQTRGDFTAIPLYRDGPLVGAALNTCPGSSKTLPLPLPCYVSPGHLISLSSSLALTLQCCIRPTTRLPEPIILADRLGRDEVKRLWG